MMQDDNTRLALRSEKARKLIGAIPSKIVRYGLLLVLGVLILLFVIVSYFPYREIYHGDLRIAQPHNISSNEPEAIFYQINVEMRFEGKRLMNVEGQGQFRLYVEGQEQGLRLISIMAERDAEGYQKACIISENYKELLNRTLAFRLVIDRGSILSQLILSNLFFN